MFRPLAAFNIYPPPLALPGLGVSNNNSKCQNSFIKSHDVNFPPSSSPPGGPAHSAGQTPNLLKLCFFDDLGRLFSILGCLFSIFGRFLRVLKIMKKRFQKNMPQNLKSRPPDRPNVDLGIDFGSLFASFFR